MTIRILDYSKIDAQRKDLVVYKINESKSQVYDILSQEGYSVEKGRRFNDNSYIFNSLISFIGDQINSFDAEAINLKFLSIESTQIDKYIYRAVLDAANADFYYTYEKEY
jgi:hypothetical protein